MHQKLFEKLSINTFLLQFYGFLARGFFAFQKRQEIHELIKSNIDRLHLMKNDIEWDGRSNDLVVAELSKTEAFVNKAKKNLKFEQVCEDKDIAAYLMENQEDFLQTGIALVDLKNIIDISNMLKNGYMLHDTFSGYPEKNLYRYHIHCLDFAHSAAYFYNEGYEYYHKRKEVNYNVDLSRSKYFELKRIQPKEEIMFRNFREAYINILFFMESFINSVGFDAYLGGFAKSIDEENQLKGIQSFSKSGFRRYSNLRQRLENIPRIINNIEIDTSQEPLKSYLEREVELRNKYVHSSPEKGRIKLGLEDWKSKSDKMIQSDCYDVLHTFWKDCYPEKSFPKVIFNAFWGNSFKGHQGKFVAFD